MKNLLPRDLHLHQLCQSVSLILQRYDIWKPRFPLRAGSYRYCRITHDKDAKKNVASRVTTFPDRCRTCLLSISQCGVWQHPHARLQSHPCQFLAVWSAPVHQRPHRYTRAVCQLLFRHCFHNVILFSIANYHTSVVQVPYLRGINIILAAGGRTGPRGLSWRLSGVG